MCPSPAWAWQADLFYNPISLGNVMLAGNDDQDLCSVYLTGFDTAATDLGPPGPIGVSTPTVSASFDSRSAALDLGRLMYALLATKTALVDTDQPSRLATTGLLEVPSEAVEVLKGLLRPNPATRLSLRMAAARLSALLHKDPKAVLASGASEGETAAVNMPPISAEETAWWEAVEHVDASDGGAHECKVSYSRDDAEAAFIRACLSLGAYWDKQSNKGYKAMELYSDAVEHASRVNLANQGARELLGDAYNRLADSSIRAGRHEMGREVLKTLRKVQEEELRRLVAPTQGDSTDSPSVTASAAGSAGSSPRANPDGAVKMSEAEQQMRLRMAATSDLIGLTSLALAENLRGYGQESKAQQELHRALGEFVRSERELQDVGTDVAMAQFWKVRAHKATVYRIKGVFDRALHGFEEAMDARRKVLTKNDPEIATYLLNMGRVFAKKGDLDVAIDLLTKAHEKLMAALGEPETPKPDTILIADTRTRLGDLYRLKKQLHESLGWYQLALEMKESNLPPFHPELAASYHAIGLFFEDSKEQANSAVVYKKALKIRRVVLPPDSLDTAATLHRLAVVACVLKEPSAAMTYYQEAHNILAKWGPSLDLADVLCSVASLQQTEGDSQAALRSLCQAYTVYQQIDLPENDPRVARIMNHIQAIKSRQGAMDPVAMREVEAAMRNSSEPCVGPGCAGSNARGGGKNVGSAAGASMSREEMLEVNAAQSEARSVQCDATCVIM